MSERKRGVAEMTGELLREAGVPIIVLYPVKEGVSGGFDLRQALSSVMFGLVLYAVGMVVERKRS